MSFAKTTAFSADVVIMLLAGKIKLPEVWPHEYKGKPLTITNETGFSAEVAGIFARGEFTHVWLNNTAYA